MLSNPQYVIQNKVASVLSLNFNLYLPPPSLFLSLPSVLPPLKPRNLYSCCPLDNPTLITELLKV